MALLPFASAPGSGSASPLTTKGDIYVFSTTNTRLPVGVNGQVLSADSTQTTGLKWSAAGSGTVTSVSQTVPTGLTITGSPITTTGTLAIGLDAGYVIPLQSTLNTYVVGPGSATDTAVALYSGTSGKLIKNSSTTIDANNNISFNNYVTATTSTASAGGITVLTAASSRTQILTGSLSQTYQLPDATTMQIEMMFVFNNNSSGSLIVTNNGGTTLYTVPSGGLVYVAPTNVSTANGTWDIHPWAPSTVTWSSGTTGLVMNNVLNTTPSINAGTPSATVPAFIPQRGSSTTGFGGDSTHLYGIIGGTAVYSQTATTVSINGATANYALNVAGTGLNARMQFQGGAGDNPGVEFTNDSTGTRRTLIRLNESGASGTELAYYTRPDAGGAVVNTITMKSTGDLNMTAGGKITNLGTPSASTDGATKGYVDTNFVPVTRTVNGHALSANVTVTQTDVFPWTDVTGTSQTAAVDNGYIADNAALVTVTLPATAAVGNIVEVAGKGAGGWKVAQNSGQTINFGSSATTAGVGGSLASTNRYDCIRMVCVTTNTTWVVLSSVGSLTVV